MKYINQKSALYISSLVLLLAGVLDIIRGIAHTFRVRHAAENFAKIEINSDNLVLMSAFGISNFLTGFIYFLIVWKAKKIVPYVLAIIPLSYFLGGIGMRYSNVVMESEFRGQHMMSIYIKVCFFTALYYFIASYIEKKRKVSYE
jgi:hypothetical protein